MFADWMSIYEFSWIDESASLKELRDLFEWNVCAKIRSTDLLQMSLSTLCLNKTKYDPSRHMRLWIFEQLFCRWQMMKMCFLAEGLFGYYFCLKMKWTRLVFVKMIRIEIATSSELLVFIIWSRYLSRYFDLIRLIE